MDNEKWQVRLHGVRGSLPAVGAQFLQYGGDTLCVQVAANDTSIIFDGGTGIRHAADLPMHVHLLLGHPHFDHLIGLGMWPAFFQPGRRIDIYMAPCGGAGARETLQKLYAPPLWPVGLEQFPADVHFYDITGPFSIGGVTVDVLSGNHPGGVTHFRISDGQRSLVYATDCELDEDAFSKLSSFSEDCGLLLCDGQMQEKDFPAKRGWGHSLWSDAAALGAACHASQTLLIHFDPGSDDKILADIDKKLSEQYPCCRLAKQGESWYL